MDFEVLQVTEASAGVRVDAFLATQLNISRSRAAQILETATVDGAAVKAKYCVRAGQEVRFCRPDPDAAVQNSTAVQVAPEDYIGPELVVWEDDSLLVLNKPAGLTVHAGAGDTGITLVERLRAQGVPLSTVGPPERAGIVHRLDKDTTGLIIVCKTDEAHWKLAADFEGRRIVKTYEAVICGQPPARGRIEAPIGRHHTSRKKMAVVPEGRMAVTEYAVRSQWEKFAHIQINLLTGRTHQIRVHAAYMHHPVVGDGVYGGLHRALTSAPDERTRRAIEALPGQALHAAHLRFDHPVSGEQLEFNAPLPAPMAELLAALEAYAPGTNPNEVAAPAAQERKRKA